MPNRPTTYDYPNDPTLRDDMRSLRQGTRQQHESEWIFIPAGEARDVPHQLGEIPWAISVIASVVSDGKAPTTLPAGVTTSMDTTNVTITNGSAANLYFRVRAM